MTLKLSELSGQISHSEIRNMSIECDLLGGINMSQGICDLELPTPVREGAENAMNKGINHYTRYDGIAELRQAIAQKMNTYNGVYADPEKNIIVSCGATGAFYSACLALLNKGDEVILFEPYYGYHVSTLIAAGAVPVFVKMNPPLWDFDLSDLERVVTSKTKGIMICTPSNPCGKVFSLAELNLLADFAVKHDIFVFTDEIYEYFVYDDHKHVSPGSIESIADRTISISGYSKTFSITGWRIGYSVSHEKWAKVIGYVSDLIYVCGPAPLQMGVANGIDSLEIDYYEYLRREYLLKRNRFCEALKKVGITPYVPQGAYYVLADVSDIPGENSKQKAMYILKKVGIASVPGCAFFAHGGGDNLVRFCFAKSHDVIDEACDRILTLNS